MSYSNIVLLFLRIDFVRKILSSVEVETSAVSSLERLLIFNITGAGWWNELVK